VQLEPSQNPIHVHKGAGGHDMPSCCCCGTTTTCTAGLVFCCSAVPLYYKDQRHTATLLLTPQGCWCRPAHHTPPWCCCVYRRCHCLTGRPWPHHLHLLPCPSSWQRPPDSQSRGVWPPRHTSDPLTQHQVGLWDAFATRLGEHGKQQLNLVLIYDVHNAPAEQLSQVVLLQCSWMPIAHIHIHTLQSTLGAIPDYAAC